MTFHGYGFAEGEDEGTEPGEGRPDTSKQSPTSTSPHQRRVKTDGNTEVAPNRPPIDRKVGINFRKSFSKTSRGTFIWPPRLREARQISEEINRRQQQTNHRGNSRSSSGIDGNTGEDQDQVDVPTTFQQQEKDKSTTPFTERIIDDENRPATPLSHQSASGSGTCAYMPGTTGDTERDE